MQFIWFWTFWHWSREGHRAGSLLRRPVPGVGGHWDEWFRHEASETECRAIAQVGRSEASQRQFIAWFIAHWMREADLGGYANTWRFLLGQLAQVEPFSQWTAFERYRKGYRAEGISAIVLSEKSRGESQDVRKIEAMALPFDATAANVVAEGFHADSLELESPRRAAASLLGGKGLIFFLALWIAAGRRAYPRWLQAGLGLGWIAVGGLIVYLAAGPDPGDKLFAVCAGLVALWGVLTIVAFTAVACQCFKAWRAGKFWGALLAESQVRLRMDSGLTLKGGSAGLSFCLNTLLSVYRASANRRKQASWLWQQVFQRLRQTGRNWAATGVVTEDGYLRPVVLEPKLRACLQREDVRHLLTPHQAGASKRATSDLARVTASESREAVAPALPPGALRLGLATEESRLQLHPCRHLAQTVMCVGDLNSKLQLACNVFAVAVSLMLLCAAPGLRGILAPPAAPKVVPPRSTSPENLWVSLDTRHPDFFQVALESRYWSNRRARVFRAPGVQQPARAEIPLHQQTTPGVSDADDGNVWVERRNHFLTREFAPGQRVGHYTLTYLDQLGHE